MSKNYFFKDDKILLEYYPEVTTIESILNQLDKEEIIHLGALTLEKRYIEHFGEDYIMFCIGERKGNYYYLNKNIFENQYDFVYHIDLVEKLGLKLEEKDFYQGRFAKVIKLISDCVQKEVKIVPDDYEILESGYIPISDYKKLISSFPNQREISLYKRKVIESIIGNYFENLSSIEKYNNYVNKMRNKVLEKKDIIQINKTLDIYKYELILLELTKMLEGNYSELEWQEKLIPIILLMYPKYVKCIKKVRIFIGNGHYKEIDYLLIDAEGNIDIIELKKPFEDCVLRKAEYRKNFIPGLELSGAIQQVQKYIYYLETFKSSNEDYINKKYFNELNGLTIKIINPQAIIICGRSFNFDQRQKQDYEIIRRQYKSLMEIITFDDLILRLQTTIRLLKK